MNNNLKLLNSVQTWLNPIFDQHTQNKVIKLLNAPINDLEESFYKNLEFGTGGMRGIMGVGDNRINKYTLGKSTQGIANYMHTIFPNEPLKVVIAYDCRHNSKSLAKSVADVFSANGIQVYLFSDLRPTPELSFALKHLGCQCGIVLTASHNPPEYNGYKVYWKDGGQIVPPEDRAIIQSINSIDYTDINFQPNEELIQLIDQEIDSVFIQNAINNTNFKTPLEHKKNLSIVFTSLHGTSINIVPEALSQSGFSNFHLVLEQSIPDGDFPTVKSPNPEEPEALQLASQLAEKTNADIVIGTDPDCDRLGIAVRDNKGRLVLLNGNQSMIVMTAFLLEQWKKEGKLNGKQFVGSTIVSTPMIIELANYYGVECKLGLTGFKWIAKMIKDFPELQFIGGGEESFGYMVGDDVRDKDAITSTLLIAEIAAQTKAKGSSIYKELVQHYVDYGYYKEHLIAITKKGQEGLAEINQMMNNLRENPLKEINGQRVIRVEDYKSSVAYNFLTNEEQILATPKGDVLIYYTEDGSKICARPSGTEPKIKFYISVRALMDSIDSFNEVDNILNEKIKNITTVIQLV
jgi:phosphoglucomutase